MKKTSLAVSEFPPEPRIPCVGASPRAGGNSDGILETLKWNFTAGGIPCDAVRLRELEFSPCIACEACRKDHICRGCKDQMQALYPQHAIPQDLSHHQVPGYLLIWLLHANHTMWPHDTFLFCNLAQRAITGRHHLFMNGFFAF